MHCPKKSGAVLTLAEQSGAEALKLPDLPKYLWLRLGKELARKMQANISFLCRCLEIINELTFQLTTRWRFPLAARTPQRCHLEPKSGSFAAI